MRLNQLGLWVLLTCFCLLSPTHAAAGAQTSANCTRTVRVGTFDQAAPYSVAAITRWVDDGGTCWTYWRQAFGLRALELLDRGDLDLAILGSTPYASSVARGAKVTAVSVLKNIAGSEGVVACEQVDRLQAMRGKIFMAPYASTAHYTLLATIVEAGIDVNEVTVLTRAPAEIVAAWDAGEIHGGACWGACIAHMLSNPRGGDIVPGHVVVDAGTVGRWNYRTFDVLAANDAFLARSPDLVGKAVDAFARASYDYEASFGTTGGWAYDGGAYLGLVQEFANLAGGSRTRDDVAAAMARDEYPTTTAQLADPIWSPTRSQAVFLFDQKALFVDPREQDQAFYEAAFDPSSLKIASTETTPLGASPRALPLATTAPLLPSPDGGCAPVGIVSLVSSVGKDAATLADGSAENRAYAPSATCLWAVATPGTRSCVDFEVSFLSSEAPYDRLEVFDAGGTLRATYLGRSGAAQPAVRACFDDAVDDERRVATCRGLLDGSDVADPEDGSDAADAACDGVEKTVLYVRWATDADDETPVPPVRVGFAATAKLVDLAAPCGCVHGAERDGANPGECSCVCDPGWGGAFCEVPYCVGVVDLARDGGTIRAAPAGHDYASFARCGWKISTRGARNRVALSFDGMIDVEPVYDSLRVYASHAVEGYAAVADTAAAGAMCTPSNTMLKAPMLFESDVLVTFESDGLVGRSGFELNWALVKPDCASQCVHGSCDVNDACICEAGWYGLDCAANACFGPTKLSARGGRIKSGNAMDYASLMVCTWVLDADPPSRILRLRFRSIDLEPIGREAVAADTIKVYAGGLEGLPVRTINARIPAIPNYKGPPKWLVQGTSGGVDTFTSDDELEVDLGDARSATIVFNSDAANPKAYEGFDLDYAFSADYCNAVWPCAPLYVCEDLACVEAPSPSSKKKSSSDDTAWIVVVAIAASLVFLGAVGWAVKFYRSTRKMETERAVLVRDQLNEAKSLVSDFQAPFCTIAGDAFVALGELVPHEVLRDKGAVRVYDVTANLKKARADGEEVFVFLSHQWLAYDNPDPEGVHFAAMTHAVGLAAAKAGVPLSKLRVWVDIVSIPQVNRSSQRLAVASLPTFASCCDLFIVVAPDATHHDTLLKCDSKTFRSRSWCRAEISACWARNGTENMFYATNSGLKLLAPNGALRPEALEVFSGGLTCCGLNHPDGMPCDKEALMLPMLGLFIEIYAQRGAKRDAWHRVAPRLDALYPKHFEYTTCAGDGGASVTETLPLFGDLIEAAMASVDAGKGPRELMYGYAPGASARSRDKVHAGRSSLLRGLIPKHSGSQSERSLRSLFRGLRPSSSRTSMASTKSTRSSPCTPCRTVSSEGSTAELPILRTSVSAGFAQSMTWHASPPAVSARGLGSQVSFGNLDGLPEALDESNESGPTSV